MFRKDCWLLNLSLVVFCLGTLWKPSDGFIGKAICIGLAFFSSNNSQHWKYPTQNHFIALNIPYINVSKPDEKFSLLQDYTAWSNKNIKQQHNESEQLDILYKSEKKLFRFIDQHSQDLWTLLVQLDRALEAMVQFKTTKKMTGSEKKIRVNNAHVPFGVYASPEYKCLGMSYYIASSQSVEDVQTILNSEKKPTCLTVRGGFSFGGYYHRSKEARYTGPHGEIFTAVNSLQGLHCENNIDGEKVCIYKVAPREVFPESVRYEPMVSYSCGSYRYILPPTADVRCVFSAFSMSFTLKWGYNGVRYKHNELSFSYPNGQVFFTDEPRSGLSCWNYVCKWRHNQAQRKNRVFAP